MEAKQPKRTHIPIGEDQERLLQYANIDTSAEDAWTSDILSTQKQSSLSLLRAHAWLINTCLLVLVVLLQVQILVMRRGALGGNGSEGGQQVGGDYLQKEPLCTLLGFSPEIGRGQHQDPHEH